MVTVIQQMGVQIGNFLFPIICIYQVNTWREGWTHLYYLGDFPIIFNTNHLILFPEEKFLLTCNLVTQGPCSSPAISITHILSMSPCAVGHRVLFFSRMFLQWKMCSHSEESGKHPHKRKAESTPGYLWAVRAKCVKNALLNQQRFYRVPGGTAR